MVLIVEPRDIESFVYHSNAIEGAPVDSDSPWVTKHLAGVHQVIADALLGTLTPPETLHEILFAGLSPIGDNAGAWREVLVRVGDDIPPSPDDLPRLMTRWWSSVSKAAQDEREHLSLDKAWFYHNAFECIHPFIDGNGRVGRLILNQLALLSDNPWVTIYEPKKQLYYQKIIRFRHTEWPAVYARWMK